MRIAIIPARGGSKRIPNKNIRLFDGKPLLSYSIEAAKRSELFDQIIVSTDSEQIADVAQRYGATVPFVRPPELSDDHTGTRPVTNHAIEAVQHTDGKVDMACCIYATAPFLQADYLRQGFEALQQNTDKGFAFSVTSFPFPIQRAIKMAEGGVAPMYPEYIKKRSQDLQEAYHDAGQFYWGTTEAYLSTKAMFSTHSIPVVLPRHLVQDIDTPEDWLRAELMYRAYVKSQTQCK